MSQQQSQSQQATTTLPTPAQVQPPAPVSVSLIKITYDTINVNNINQLSLINHYSLPVKYSTGFYHQIISKYNKNSRFVYYNDIIIGGFTVRTQEFEGKNMSYILTFIVLEKYRMLKIGSQMIREMERVLKGEGKDEKEKQGEKKVEGIYLHVHVMNESAINFYKKQGFVEKERLENYYKTIEQPHALVLVKMFE